MFSEAGNQDEGKKCDTRGIGPIVDDHLDGSDTNGKDFDGEYNPPPANLKWKKNKFNLKMLLTKAVKKANRKMKCENQIEASTRCYFWLNIQMFNFQEKVIIPFFFIFSWNISCAYCL